MFNIALLDNILNDNNFFVKSFKGEKLPHHAQINLVILTCMDCRLTGFLESALGIQRGDAKIIRNAGNTIVGEDAIRSIAVAIYNLGADEVMVIGHTECGMANADIDSLKEKMISRGISQKDIEKYDLAKWIGGFGDEKENVVETCEKIKTHPLIPDVPVHGLIIDIQTGKLDVLVNGY